MLTQEQLALRRTGVTGSEIAAVAGLSPYAGPLEIWLIKKDIAEPVEETHHIERGNFFEPAMLGWYAQRTQQTLRYPGTIRHPKHPLILATPDAVTDRCGVETKSPSRRTWWQWGEPGTDSIPEHYIPQVTFEAAVLGVPSVDVVTVLDDNLAIFPVEFDEKLFGLLVECVERFWRNHVVADVPPPPDGGERARRWLLEQHPRATVMPLLEATSEMVTLARMYDKARAEMKHAEGIKELTSNQLRALLAQHAGAAVDGVKITYKNDKDGITVDWESIVKTAQVPESIIAAHTHKRIGNRVLRVTIKDEK